MAYDLTCSITAEPFKNPVVASDGFTYERSAIVEWLQTNDTSPMTREPLLVDHLVPNRIVQSLVQEPHALTVHWTDPASNAAGTEAFRHASATIHKLKRRLHASQITLNGQMLSDDAPVPFGSNVTIHRGSDPARKTSQTTSRWTRTATQVQVLLGSAPAFWLDVPDKATASKVKKLIAREQQRRKLTMTPNAVATTRLTTWRASINGPIVSIKLTAGCHDLDLSQDVGQAVCPFDEARVLSRVAKKLHLPVQTLSLSVAPQELLVAVACTPPPTMRMEVHNLSATARLGKVAFESVLVHANWTIKHLKKHLPVPRCHSLQLFVNGQQLTDDSSVPVSGPLQLIDACLTAEVKIVPGCHAFGSGVLFYVCCHTSVQENIWQASQLLGVPSHKLNLVGNQLTAQGFLLTVECLMSDPNLDILVIDYKEHCLMKVAADWSVAHLKQHLALLQKPNPPLEDKLSADQMRLVFDCAEIQDGDTLNSCRVRDGSTMHLIPRMFDVQIVWADLNVRQIVGVCKHWTVAKLQQRLSRDLPSMSAAEGVFQDSSPTILHGMQCFAKGPQGPMGTQGPQGSMRQAEEKADTSLVVLFNGVVQLDPKVTLGNCGLGPNSNITAFLTGLNGSNIRA